MGNSDWSMRHVSSKKESIAIFCVYILVQNSTQNSFVTFVGAFGTLHNFHLLSAYTFTCRVIHSFVHPPIYLSIHPSIHLSIHPERLTDGRRAFR